jgi:hypothetical protein
MPDTRLSLTAMLHKGGACSSALDDPLWRSDNRWKPPFMQGPRRPEKHIEGRCQPSGQHSGYGEELICDRNSAGSVIG